MRVFKDNAGRSWSLSINIASVKRVKSVLGFDLLALDDGKLFERLADDPILCADVLYVLCKPESDTLGVTDEQFGAALAGDAFEQACDSLIDEVFDFFPQAKRVLMQKLKTKFLTYRDKQTQLAQAMVENLSDNDIEKMLRSSAKNTQADIGNSSMKSQDV